MRRFTMLPVTSLVALSILVGCQGLNLPIAGGGGKFGNLTFSPASPNSLAMISSANSDSTQSGASTAAPMAPSAGNAMSAPSAGMAMGAPAPSAMKMAPGYPGGYYGGGFWGTEYELVATNEAKAPGFNGTYSQALETYAKPMVQDWAPDAVLRSVSGNVDGSGINPRPNPMSSDMTQPGQVSGGVATSAGTTSSSGTTVAVGTPVMSRPTMVMPIYRPSTGWRLEFASRAKRESLYFLIGGESSLIIKQTFKERQNDIGAARLGSAEVIALVTKAIQDKTVTASDPAMMGSGGGGYGYAVPVMASGGGTAASGTVNATTAVTGPAMSTPPTAPPTLPMIGPSVNALPYTPPTNEELFTVPTDARWDVSLSNEPYQNGNTQATRLIWNVNMNTNPMTYGPMPMNYAAPNGGSNTYTSGAWARVDATSGQLLSLNRPRKITNYYGYYGGETKPMPAPMPMPASSTAPTPTQTSVPAASGGAATP